MALYDVADFTAKNLGPLNLADLLTTGDRIRNSRNATQLGGLQLQEAQRAMAGQEALRMRLADVYRSADSSGQPNLNPAIMEALRSGDPKLMQPIASLVSALKPTSSGVPDFLELQGARDNLKIQLNGIPEKDARRPLFENRIKELDAKLTETPKSSEPPVVVPDPRSKTGYRYVARGESYGKEAPAPASVAEKPPKMSPTEIKDALQGRAAAQTSKEAITAIEKAIGKGGLLDKGIYTGSYADLQTATSKLFGKAGFSDKKKAARTEEFTAYLGSIVLPMMQMLGGSDTVEELRYMKSVVAGDVNLEEKTIRNVLTSFKKKMQDRVGAHEAFVKSAEETYQHVPPGIRLIGGKNIEIDGASYEIVEDLGGGKVKIRDPKSGRIGTYSP